MYLLVSLLVFVTALEGLVCSEGHALMPLLRKVACAWTALLLIASTIILCVLAPRIWLWGAPLLLYRLINLLRMYRYRLPPEQLRTTSLRAFNWLVSVQVAVTVVAWLALLFDLGGVFFNVLVTVQLLGALVILRASLHTWRHAGAPNDRTVHISDKELPSVSVLVPARNETDDLKRCLNALVASEYPKLEVLVLDDCSAGRRTPEIIRSFAHAGVRFVQGEVPDETRWLAKNYAYAQLAKAASGNVLLFCGVDALLEPQSIGQLIGLLETRGKDMLSVMPLHAPRPGSGSSLLQSMRYFWEMCLPRRVFKRPPVLSSCWLIRAAALKRVGGFASVSRSVVPEAPLARAIVATDAYAFVRSDQAMGIYSAKPASEQYATSIRVRYPQLHRRLELVALAFYFELVFLLGPVFGLLYADRLTHAMAYIALWGVAAAALGTSYGLITGGARLASSWFGWLLMPVAFIVDLAVLHVSLWQYEFGNVSWKGRNVCIPVMQLQATNGKPKTISTTSKA